MVQIYADSAPNWIAKTFENDPPYFVTSTGIPIRSQSAPGYCFDHQGVRNLTLQFYKQIANVGKKFKSLYGYDLWSEPHIVNWVWFNDMPEVQFCYCKHTQNRFRSWLQHKYFSISNLNNAWYRSFETWDQVEAPRFGTILSDTDFMDWMEFTTDKLAQDLNDKGQAVHEIDPNHIRTSHSASPSVMHSPLGDYGNPDDWKMSQQPMLDFYGSSFYPKHAMTPLGGRDAAERSFMFNGMYSATHDRGFFVGELQAGQGVTGMRVNEPVTAYDHRDYVWSLLANGAQSIFFFAHYPMSSGYEAGGYGMINLDGTLTDRAKTSGSIGNILSKYGYLFRNMRPERAHVGILYNVASYFAGGNTVGPGVAVKDSMLGFYRALFEKSIPTKFVHPTDIINKGQTILKQFKVLYLPFPIALDERVSKALKEFVQLGGNIISEARAGWIDQNGNAYNIVPGAGLDEMFCVRESLLKNANDKTAMTFVPNAFGNGTASITVTASIFVESLQMLRNDCKVMARFETDGSIAAVESHFGKGKTLFLGTFLGVTNEKLRQPNAMAVLQEIILSWANIEPTVNVLDQKDVEVRLLTGIPQKMLLIVIDRSSKQQRPVHVKVNGYNLVSALDIIHERIVQISSILVINDLNFEGHVACLLLTTT
jgi:hypothetical protein